MRGSEVPTDQVTAVRGAVDQLLAGEVGPLLDLLADDVEFELAAGGDLPGGNTGSGKQAVVDYFAGMGGVVAFWQMDYTAAGDQVIAWGKERFTIEGCELEGACELALVFDIDDGVTTRLLVVEDLRAFVRGVVAEGSLTPESRTAPDHDATAHPLAL